VRTGKALPFRGPEPLTLKLSLVNRPSGSSSPGSMARFCPVTRRTAASPRSSCQTRLFGPADHAGEVLSRITS